MNNVLVIVYSCIGASRRVARSSWTQQGWPLADEPPPSDCNPVVFVSPAGIVRPARTRLRRMPARTLARGQSICRRSRSRRTAARRLRRGRSCACRFLGHGRGSQQVSARHQHAAHRTNRRRPPRDRSRCIAGGLDRRLHGTGPWRPGRSDQLALRLPRQRDGRRRERGRTGDGRRRRHPVHPDGRRHRPAAGGVAARAGQQHASRTMELRRPPHAANLAARAPHPPKSFHRNGKPP